MAKKEPTQWSDNFIQIPADFDTEYTGLAIYLASGEKVPNSTNLAMPLKTPGPAPHFTEALSPDLKTVRVLGSNFNSLASLSVLGSGAFPGIMNPNVGDGAAQNAANGLSDVVWTNVEISYKYAALTSSVTVSMVIGYGKVDNEPFFFDTPDFVIAAAQGATITNVYSDKALNLVIEGTNLNGLQRVSTKLANWPYSPPSFHNPNGPFYGGLHETQQEQTISWTDTKIVVGSNMIANYGPVTEVSGHNNLAYAWDTFTPAAVVKVLSAPVTVAGVSWDVAYDFFQDANGVDNQVRVYWRGQQRDFTLFDKWKVAASDPNTTAVPWDSIYKNQTNHIFINPTKGSSPAGNNVITWNAGELVLESAAMSGKYPNGAYVYYNGVMIVGWGTGGWYYDSGTGTYKMSLGVTKIV